MANTTGVTEGAGVAVAERVAAAHSLWLSSLPTIRRTPIGDLLPKLLGGIALEPLTEPIAAPVVAVIGTLAAGHGPVSDMAVSPDGRYLITAHYGADVVCLIDTATLSVSATIDGISEPGSVVVADRAYVSAASNDQDAVVAVDTRTGVPLAAKKFDMVASGLAVSPAGDMLYVARTGEDDVDVAAIDTESGDITAIEIPAAPGASVVALRISADGTRLFAALAAPTGAALAIVDTGTRAVERTVAIAGSIGDIAVAPHGRTVFATGWDAEFGGVIHVIDVAGGRVTDTIGVGGMPTQLVLSRRGECAYVVDRNEIAVLCTATSEIVDSIVLGPELSCLAADPVRERVYVADYAGGITALRVEMTAERPQLTAAAS
ncbi:YncE family protein [Mycolicibacterium sp. CH28]|uniref:YncE family protein n=1 Tax=Mycolicibacterium sp. CH28 TaxID=2512237 RepID=UPI001080DBD2|nr:YncE family protein [Mycolicibacterium sp. CH28]TGD85515.1 YncE family protein [Mycolicibacterium sp. CH28]